eukprot:1129509-Prymnesium_polylepis.1
MPCTKLRCRVTARESNRMRTRPQTSPRPSVERPSDAAATITCHILVANEIAGTLCIITHTIIHTLHEIPRSSVASVASAACRPI